MTLATQFVHRRQQGDPRRSHEDVGRPDTQPDGHRAVAGEFGAKNEDDVVGADQRNGQDESAGASSSARARADRQSDQRKNQAGRGEGEAPLKLHVRLRGVRPFIGQKLAQGALGIDQCRGLCCRVAANAKGLIAFAESGKPVMFRALSLRFVHGALAQKELQLALVAVGDYNGVLCQGQARNVAPVRFRQKDAMPVHGGGRDILHIEHQVRKLLVEDARLNLEGSLRAAQAFFERAQRANGDRAEPHRHAERDASRQQRQQRRPARAGACSPIPAAFMAINSLSADMRPRPISTPTSTPMGTLNVSTRGNALKKSSAIWCASPECRATTFMICTSCGTKMTNVKTPRPSNAWERTSRKI